ncbi:MAG: S9 family peptidase, partial [Candidatus Krumholzibacteriaceae bacterium]
MRRIFFALVALVVMTGAAGAAIDKDYLAKLPPMIDRSVLFGDPQIARGQISPDGTHISFLKQYKNILNIWVKGVDEPFEAARPMTADTTRPVRSYFWSMDGKYILYIQDKGGDENWHVYAVDPRAKLEPGRDVPAARDLTPYEKVAAEIYALPKRTPNYIFVGLNDRDERYHDAYRIDLTTGERKLVKRNDKEIAAWIFDLEGNLRLAAKQTDDGGTDILRVDPDSMTVVYSCSKDETVDPIRYSKDGKRVYMSTDKGAGVNLARLILFDPATGKEELVESDPMNQVDFGGAEFSEKTDELVATYYVGDRLRIYFKDPAWDADYKRLQKQLPDGDIYLGSATSDEHLWTVSVTSDVDPGATYLYDRGTGKATLLYRPYPDLPLKYLASMKPIVYTSRDGLEIHGYLTVPRGVKDKNLPLLVMPHGGPWARDEWGYDPYAQFFANRGYAMLQMNFRGSTGYGKKFLNAGNKQWGDAMQNDITDGVRYLVKKGIADPKQVAIFGGSYGGYATLAGLAFTPDVYAAGISYVGPSNIITLLNSIPPYWAVLKATFNERVGDPSKPEDAERLKRQSPLFSAKNITAPLLVVQGANDPRVKKAESDQIVVALRDLGRDVEYIVAPDEGHGFAGADNRMALSVAIEKFLSKHLGGRYQQDVPEKLEKRLEAITVDVKTVSLAPPPKSAAEAEKAPLPAANGSLLKPLSLVYKGTGMMGSKPISLDVTRTIAKGAVSGAPTWQIVTNQSSGQGGAVDTFDVDASTLIPLR